MTSSETTRPVAMVDSIERINTNVCFVSRELQEDVILIKLLTPSPAPKFLRYKVMAVISTCL
jgi:hypothetical protein